MTTSPTGSALRCAICGRPAIAAYRPFCSRRCADVDLGRWITGQYRAPGPEQDSTNVEEDDEAS